MTTPKTRPGTMQTTLRPDEVIGELRSACANAEWGRAHACVRWMLIFAPPQQARWAARYWLDMLPPALLEQFDVRWGELTPDEIRARDLETLGPARARLPHRHLTLGITRPEDGELLGARLPGHRVERLRHHLQRLWDAHSSPEPARQAARTLEDVLDASGAIVRLVDGTRLRLDDWGRWVLD